MNAMEKEILAYYGRLVYYIQIVEKEFLNRVLLSQENTSKSRQDELYMELSQLTFGQLKSKIVADGLIESDLAERLDEFHKKRDWLVHRYFWDRAVEFNNPEMQIQMLSELDSYTTEFAQLVEDTHLDARKYLDSKGLDYETLMNEMLGMEATPADPEYRKLTKSETVIDIYRYNNKKGFESPVFVLADGTQCILCESGLSVTFMEFNEDFKFPLPQLDGIFPISNFNSRPKINSPWDYELDLKIKGLKMSASAHQTPDGFRFSWKIDS